MSVVSDSMRSDVEQRAGHRCEYCHVPTRGQVAPFPVDHVQPESGGGLTVLDNLALTCPPCNGHKWKHTEGIDPVTEQSCPLFNPRSDAWDDHFEWSAVEIGVLVGNSADDSLRRLPQSGIDDVHAGIAQRPGHHLDAAIMAIEANLRQNDAEGRVSHADDFRANFLPSCCPIVPAKNVGQRVHDFADGAASPS